MFDINKWLENINTFFWDWNIVTIIIALIVAAFTVNRNWKQQKYFRLQEEAQNVISLLWRWQDLSSILEELDHWSHEWESISNQKQKTYENMYAKLQIYFSQSEFPKISKLWKELAEEIPSKDRVKIDALIQKLRKSIIYIVNCKWRNWFVSKRNYWFNSDENYDI